MAYNSLKEIDAGITKLRGLTKNVNKMVQELACAVVVHAFGSGEGQGSNDVSRASKLVKALPNSFRREYLIRWFENAGIAIGSADKGYPARMVSKDSKRFRQPAERIDFANSNNWFDAVDADGNRSPWYQGPTPKEQEPNTLVEFADNIINFADRTAKQVREGKLKDGKTPAFVLTDDQRKLVDMQLGLIRETAAALKTNASADRILAQLQQAKERAEEGMKLLGQAHAYSELTKPADENSGDNAETEGEAADRTGTEG